MIGTNPLRRTAVAAALVAAMATATGCGVTVANLPMPKPGIGAPGYTIRAAFRDALNLPDHAHVKIGGTDIGVVTAISTTNFIAEVEMLIREDIQLPRGTTAELRQATPLGDIFVAMTLPATTSGGENLRAGDVIGTDHTSAAASVEQLMMSVSMLINGGGINQAAKITSEMDSMFAGRAPQLAHLLSELTNVIAALNQRTGDIDSVLTGLNVLTGELARRKAELGDAADTFPGLLAMLAENNQSIVDLLDKVSTTMTALGDFTETTGPQAVSLFDSIQRLMAGFTQMGDDLGGTLDGLHTIYPSLMASLDGPALAVAATVSYLSVGALTDPSGSRLPEIGDVPAFIGSLAQVIEKVIGRVTSPPQQPQQQGGER
ncbi:MULTISPECIES: MCE family protein [Nocardia]|uniref:MCE family protein n=1 Tax=Nocardia implantans TaxID=3108168 RepID=A0ABU6AUQ9_9NOCA|nr:MULTISPECIES: MCE family protein [unclassified Nocardia]MBF6192583.1 MCE family protein [Nocardia beijingensis]MEA3527510.1 MCE family protein [Nocardia sp. CDC192]MEB3511218.1 MCE family protein [Nocardia sp. CDC186]